MKTLPVVWICDGGGSCCIMQFSSFINKSYNEPLEALHFNVTWFYTECFRNNSSNYCSHQARDHCELNDRVTD